MFESAKEQVRQDYISKKSQTMAKEAAESMLAALKEQKSIEFASEVQKYDKTLEDSGYITRNDFADSQLPSQIATLGFELSADSPYPEEVVSSNGRFYVFRLKERRPPVSDLFTEKENEFRTGLLERKKAFILESWLANVRSKAEIEINEQFL